MGSGFAGLGGRKDTMKDEKSGSGATPRRKFDETYKRHAVELTMRGSGRTVKAVAEELGIAPWMLYDWRKQYVPKPGGGVQPAPRTPEEVEQTIAELRAEVIRLRDREIVLKKSLGILSETPASGMPKWKR